MLAELINNTDKTVVVLGKGYSHLLPPSGTVQLPAEDAKDWLGRTKWDEKGFASARYKGGEDKHWRTAVAEVKDIADLDVLEGMLEAETRASVRTAIEARMAEIVG